MRTICLGCKKVKQSDGFWKRGFVEEKEDDSTGICPECFEEQKKRIRREEG